jgi:hypothetical protein
MSALEEFSAAINSFVALAGYAAFVAIFTVGVLSCVYLVIRWRLSK